MAAIPMPCALGTFLTPIMHFSSLFHCENVLMVEGHQVVSLDKELKLPCTFYSGTCILQVSILHETCVLRDTVKNQIDFFHGI